MTVYFIQAGEDGPIKIGHTTGDPVIRRADLQVGNHVPLAILAVLDGDSETENSLHKRFAKSRLRGEWFIPSTDLNKFLASLPRFQQSRRPDDPVAYIRKHVFHLTQLEMAGLFDTTQATISRWETQGRFPSVEQTVVRDEAKKRGIPWNDRWFFEVPEPRPQPDAAA